MNRYLDEYPKIPETPPVSRPQPEIVHVQIGASYGFWFSGLVVSVIATFVLGLLMRSMLG